MHASFDSTVEFLSIFSKFASADEWDIELYRQAQNGELLELLENNSFTLTENDWRQLEQSFNDDKAISPHVKKISKSYHSILSA